MTQEEKARAYDEALEKAKFYHGNCPSEPERKKLEKIFPVLYESEDERTRNEIIAFIEQAIHSGGGISVSKEKENKWLAYLEKQKEQKPKTFNEPYNPDEYEVVMEENAINLKRKEQKSIESIAAEVTKDKESAIKFLKSAGIMDDNGELAEMYRSEPKPTEWSEEDDVTIKSAIHWLEKYLSTIRAKDVSSATQDGILTVKTTITNLKSLHPNLKK